MYFNRFDISEAWYLYLSTHYYGMDDPMYARLCKLRTHFNPGLNIGNEHDLNSNAREIYLQLTMNHYGLTPSYVQKVLRRVSL